MAQHRLDGGTRLRQLARRPFELQGDRSLELLGLRVELEGAGIASRWELDHADQVKAGRRGITESERDVDRPWRLDPSVESD
jgi:hypothetical protein